MMFKKIYDLSKEEVCLAVIDYIERDKDEKVTGTPTLYVHFDAKGIVDGIKLEAIKT